MNRVVCTDVVPVYAQSPVHGNTWEIIAYALHLEVFCLLKASLAFRKLCSKKE